MKEVKRYICEVCGTVYNDKMIAKNCEKNHKKPVEIGNCRYLPKASNTKGYPISLEVRMEDGVTIVYKR